MRRLLKFLIGCAIGAGTAMLVTPKTGRQVREALWSPQVRELMSGRVGELVKSREPAEDTGWPAAEQPAAAVAVEEPFVAEPVVEEPVVAEPVVDEAIVAVPAVEEPVVEQPVIEEPVVAEPIAEEPGEDLKARIEDTKAALASEIARPFDEPAVETPVVEEPVVEAPIMEAPVVEEPIVEAPIMEAPVVEEPIVEAPIVEEPVVEEPVVEEPVVEEPIVEEPVVEAPFVAEPVAEEPFAEPAPTLEADLDSHRGEVPIAVAETPAEIETVTEEPVPVPAVAEEPAIEEPVAEIPVADEPPVAEPAAVVDQGEAPRSEATIDQAEMRRRIEETRARLKAKAFDAMMSGEAALLSRDSGDKPVPEGSKVEVDGEVAETIDESLSQEDY